MKILHTLILIILVFLAITSGVTKVLLMQQDVDFFGAYGFNNTHLIMFGTIQILSGIALVFKKSRVVGAIVLAATFVISAVVLAISGNIPVTVITLVFVGLLGLVVHNTISSNRGKR